MDKKKRKKKQKWIKPRHEFVRIVLSPFIRLLCKMKYHIKIRGYKEKRQCLIIANHQTPFDQFFVELSFKKHLYFLTNDDIFSNGFTSWLINFLVKPIPIKKGTTDVKAILDCKRVAKEGGSIAIFPEGNRTYSGKTEEIKETIAPFVKALGLPLVIYHIKGGYGVMPRWGEKTRRGKMESYVSEVIEYDDYKDLSNEELYKLICEKLYVNEGAVDKNFFSKKSAEYLERAIYYCPTCGLSEWESKGETVSCKTCGLTVRYLPSKELLGVNCEFPYRFVSEWYDAQCKFVRSLDISPYSDVPLFKDAINLSEVIPCKKKIPMGEWVTLSAFNNRIEINLENETLVVPFDKITAMGIIGKNKINYYFDKRIFQIKGTKRFNALKYLNIYHHSINIEKGETENGSLGL